MTLLAVGVSHRSAPVAVLDRLALPPGTALALQCDLVASPHIAEALVLATCNRVEVYVDVARFHGAVDDIVERLAKLGHATRDEVTPHLYVHYDERAVQHLFEVASGLDSMVVGEQQILGQVRQSLRLAQEAATAGRALNEVVQTALRVGKRVHAETGIDRAGASVVSVALEAAAAALGGSLRGRRAVVVGAGAMSSLAASSLVRLGIAHLAVANRTAVRAHRLADHLQAGIEVRSLGLDALPEEFDEADVLVSCTGSTGLVVTAGDVARVLPSRAGRPLVVVDLALPHDTDPGLAGLPGVTRIDLAALAGLPATRASETDVATARRIVAEEVRAHAAAVAARQVEPIVVSLRARADDVVAAELHRLRLRLPGLDDAAATEVERSLRRAVAALLHTPTVRMKQWAVDPDGRRYADALHALFDLPPASVAAVSAADDAGGAPVAGPAGVPADPEREGPS